MDNDLRTLRIGLAGVGVVGQGLVSFVSSHPDFAPAGGRVVITGVSARDRHRAREVSLDDYAWFDDPVELALSDDNDVFVELIGGSEGAARAAVEAALRKGKPVITANKALLAIHGAELAAIAEATGAALLFEAAVMGGTPAVKMLREGLVGDDVTRVAGILNGTCNFILSDMEQSERSFSDVLADAQARGFAEADPTTDIGGFDAGHKIALLGALAFGASPNFKAVEVVGIDSIELLDIRLARDLGYRIKLIAEAHKVGDHASVSVSPALVPLAHPLAQAGGVLNALFIEGRRIGRIFLQGPGAGAGPTAAAVAADIADLLAGAARPVFQRPVQQLLPLQPADRATRRTATYIRLMVSDRPGVIAAVTEAIARAGLSIDSFLQRSVQNSGLVPIVLTTQVASEAAIQDAVAQISAIDAVVEAPRTIRIANI
jgi:homoserine dehydrogenase